MRRTYMRYTNVHVHVHVHVLCMFVVIVDDATRRVCLCVGRFRIPVGIESRTPPAPIHGWTLRDVPTLCRHPTAVSLDNTVLY